MKAILDAILPVVGPILFSLLVAGTGWVALHVGAWFKSKAQNSRAFGALQVFFDLAVTIVQDIENNEKAAMLKGGGAISPDQLKSLAVSRLKAVLGPEGLAALQKALGILVSGNLDAIISGTVERALGTVQQPPALQVATSPK